MRRFLLWLGILAAPAAAQIIASLPDNPIAFGNCTARVRVDAARLRSAPSLDATILGVRTQDQPLHVLKVVGKWVMVETTEGDTAYMAAYLLSFPANEILEHWKKDGPPPPALGKKVKVKWAAVNFRRYPSRASARLGRFERHDELALIAAAGGGWSLVACRKSGGGGLLFGFVADRALATSDRPDSPSWEGLLAVARPVPGLAVPRDAPRESVADYCRRTAWSPERFRLELEARAEAAPRPAPGPRLALR